MVDRFIQKSEDLLNIWLTLTAFEIFHYVFVSQSQSWVEHDHELLPALVIWGYEFWVVAAYRLRAMKALEREERRQNLTNNNSTDADELPVNVDPDSLSASTKSNTPPE